ncbi:DUF3574 domain-containing protein, partial [Streptomyces sp. NPDC089915]|uniref:DUF3574 domain-containing protein n=1 Tax=Streptomyces sp. NPDC089915 TaxID=3155186 RepID=UPI003444218F
GRWPFEGYRMTAFSHEEELVTNMAGRLPLILDGDINREKSYELTVMYPVREAAARNADIEYIRRLYCKTWELESVGRADVRAQVDF